MAMLALLAIVPLGCAVVPQGESARPAVEPPAPTVKIEGNDGTVMTGELLNGSITIACGQGELMLITNRIYSITFDKDGDSVMSGSVKVFGKIEDTELRLKTEHGIFRLQKQNLRSVQFLGAPDMAAPSATAPSRGVVAHSVGACSVLDEAAGGNRRLLASGY